MSIPVFDSCSYGFTGHVSFRAFHYIPAAIIDTPGLIIPPKLLYTTRLPGIILLVSASCLGSDDFASIKPACWCSHSFASLHV